MVKQLRFAILLCCISVAGSAFATTRYIAANGSDSNDGASKTTPWLHAPGMSGCSSNCASYTPVAGDSFILRGGDTWHRYSSGGTGGTPVGLPWSWTHSGNSSNAIYVGVDKTWYAGASWTRPVLSSDNPISTSVVSSCAHDNTGSNTLTISSANYVTFDNLEMSGWCWSGGSGAHIERSSTTHITISNFYIHGWSHTSGFTDTAWMIHGNTGGATNNVITGTTIDGSDTTQRSGFAVYGDCYELSGNTFRYLSNGAVCWNPTQIHDNMFEYIVESTDSAGTHGNVIEAIGGPSTPTWFYNNAVRHTTGGGVGLGVNVWLNVATALYFFNNVFYDIGNSANCVMLSNQQGNNTRNNSFIWNNTIDASCSLSLMVGDSTSSTFNGDLWFENNHLIGYTNIGGLIANRGGTYTTHETTDVYQTESAANSQGYTNTNAYAPTSAGDITVGSVTNLTSSCATFGAALCSDTTVGGTRTPNARPASGAWDAGAYEFNQSGSNPPNPPGGLSAVVH